MQLSLSKDINSISYIKSNFNEVLESLKKNQRPMIITQNGKSTGVLMDIESWEDMQRKMELFKSVAEGERSLLKDEPIELDKVMKMIESKYEL